MVDRGNYVVFHEDGGYFETMKKTEELKMRTLMNTMKRGRVPIQRKGSIFVVEVTVETREDELLEPKKVAAKRWSSSRNMDFDEGNR